MRATVRPSQPQFLSDRHVITTASLKKLSWYPRTRDRVMEKKFARIENGTCGIDVFPKPAVLDRQAVAPPCGVLELTLVGRYRE